MGTRVLLVELDSAEPLLTKRWMQEGQLPTLRALTAGGQSFPVRNLPGFGNGVFWPSLATCLGPADHGRYFYHQLMPGSYEVRPFDAFRDFRATPSWVEIDRRGGKVAAIDLVRTPPARVRHGLEVIDWLPHDREGAPSSRPDGLLAELHARYGADPLGHGMDTFLKRTGDHAALIAHCLQRIEWKTDFCRRQLESRDWDVFAVGYGDLHDIGHAHWHLHDLDDPRHDPRLRASLGDPLLTSYRAMDAALAELVRAAGESATIIAVTGAGFERNRTGNHMLGEILRRIEQGVSEGHPTSTPAAPGRLRGSYHRFTPSPAKSLLHRLRVAVQGTEIERARAASRAFALPNNDNAGAIRINLKGREPRGRVHPGREREALVDELCASLSEIIEPETGRPLVHDVVRVDRVTAGPHLAALPDLFVLWNREARFESAWSHRIGEIRQEFAPLRTGDHSDRGELIVTNAGHRLASVDSRRPTLTPMDAGKVIRLACGLAPATNTH